jgi:hypothetical protein
MSYSALTSVVFDEPQLFHAVFEADDCTIVAIWRIFFTRQTPPRKTQWRRLSALAHQ